MKDFKDQGAFAMSEGENSGWQNGISRLEYFAAAALTGILSSNPDHESISRDNVCQIAALASFEFAEAMCAEAEKRKAKQ